MCELYIKFSTWVRLNKEDMPYEEDCMDYTLHFINGLVGRNNNEWKLTLDQSKYVNTYTDRYAIYNLPDKCANLSYLMKYARLVYKQKFADRYNKMFEVVDILASITCTNGTESIISCLGHIK